MRTWRRAARLCIAALVLLVTAAGPVQAAPPSTPAGSPNRPADRPNIVVLLIDDLDETGGPYWRAMPKARALIADRGVTFRNAFATNPLCCPARATILTGQYPHNTGVWSVYSESIGGAEHRTLGVRLAAAGYTTAFVGKYLNGYERKPDRVPPGWDEWFALAGGFPDGYGYEVNHNGAMESFGTGKRNYQTDVLSREAVAFVEQAEADDDKPFFLLLAPSAGHWPMKPAVRHTYHPFADDALPERPNFDEADVSDKPLWLREGVPAFSDARLADETERYRRAMGTLFAVDDLVARLATQLRARGELEHTVFVFTSDNGYNRGAHRLREKMVPYDESIRVPLAVAGPGIRHGRELRFVGHPDLAPTVLDLAGADAPADVDGRSLVPLLRGERRRWRRDLLVEFRGIYGGLPLLETREHVHQVLARTGTGGLIPTYRAIRSTRWLYVEWYAGDHHDYELYDMRADPYQLENLLSTPAGRAAYEAATARLQARLEQLAACSGRSCREVARRHSGPCPGRGVTVPPDARRRLEPRADRSRARLPCRHVREPHRSARLGRRRARWP